MRIKAVLRDKEILESESGSKKRVLDAMMKNLDRVVGLSSLLKVMGLEANQRIEMLKVIETTKLHLWFGREGQQDIVYLSKNKLPTDWDVASYQWQ